MQKSVTPLSQPTLKPTLMFPKLLLKDLLNMGFPFCSNKGLSILLNCVALHSLYSVPGVTVLQFCQKAMVCNDVAAEGQCYIGTTLQHNADMKGPKAKSQLQYSYKIVQLTYCKINQQLSKRTYGSGLGTYCEHHYLHSKGGVGQILEDDQHTYSSFNENTNFSIWQSTTHPISSSPTTQVSYGAVPLRLLQIGVGWH